MLNWVLPATSAPMTDIYAVGVVCPMPTLHIGVAGGTPASTRQQQFADAIATTTLTLTTSVIFCGQLVCVYQRQLLWML